MTLTPLQSAEMMGSRYCRLIGVLGTPDAGKTAALVSLYLLLARNKLGRIRFRDSRSLMAFDELSQGARQWNEGQPPDQLTVHTELADDRSAGFLHLRLAADGAESNDLLLPDLPGEWTSSLIEKNRTDRLQFLKGADVLWLMLDGRQLTVLETRQLAIHRAKLLVQRVAALIDKSVPLLLVVTRRDQCEVDDKTLEEICAEAQSQGFSMEIFQIASFASAEGGVAAGSGIHELMLASMQTGRTTPEFWPEEADAALQNRAMMRFNLKRQA
ncbi:TRAFAC clade GTPase domain-containing protein [Bradyrhizobium genosp. A]|uniref:TRAFAC clade GTPase domain-containing protein n=1 Tax=Bradyrhizobium genosp. A TaxID=83626 RepID=UPI003CEE4EF5